MNTTTEALANAPAAPVCNPCNAEKFFGADTQSITQALLEAQHIAFAPYVFQTSIFLRDKGILQMLHENHAKGTTLEQLQENTGLTAYALMVVMEGALGIGLAIRKEDRYYLTKKGYLFLTDKTTRINTDFMRDVCYEGAADLATALEEGRPAGLRHLGNWPTIYEGLSILPQPARDSWFAFDHYYSDEAFPEAMPIVFQYKPARILDIGSNTGKFVQSCLKYDAQVEMGLVDLPVQLRVAVENLDEAGYNHRYTTYPINLLDPTAPLPANYDIIWMSQFLSCFSGKEIVSILTRCADALAPGGHILINETFWDYQRHKAAAFALQMTSVYFTAMANGNSKMWESKVFEGFIHEAGLEVVETHHNLGLSHTLLILQRANTTK